ncbi:hypothetical protein BIW11_02572 [Tropilaelaps mercedesae]|uniref:Rho-GAP domain-containing protein n=1 Tax=Tropilaelaps mercedesae TaxID=418985 RepID=A0A1V9Y0S9_9ACAR|nr:hypothetical protein BIW11_02572 [Tropilaelaps mercedesae]
MQRSHWLSSSLAPRPYLSSYPRETISTSFELHSYAEQQQAKSSQLVHNSPINQSTVSLTESIITGGSVSGAESEMSLSLPSIPLTATTRLAQQNSSIPSTPAGAMPPSVSVPASLACGQSGTLWKQSLERGQHPGRREHKTKKTKKDKRTSLQSTGAHREEGSRSSSLGSLNSPSPSLSVSVAAKLQLFEGGGQGFLARSMEKLKLYRSELTRMASPPPNTVQVRTAQFEKGGGSGANNITTFDEAPRQNSGARVEEKGWVCEDKKTDWQHSSNKNEKVVLSGDKQSGTTSPPPGVSLKKLRTLFADRNAINYSGNGCAFKVLRCPNNGKRLDHNWRPAEVHLEKSPTGNPVLRIVTDKESINAIVNKLLSNTESGQVHVSLASAELAKRRKNVLHLMAGEAILPLAKSNESREECTFCLQERETYSTRPATSVKYEFLVQCDTPVMMHRICSSMKTTNTDGVLQIGPSVIERAAAFDRRFIKKHRSSSVMNSENTLKHEISKRSEKPLEMVLAQRSKSRRASVGEERSFLSDRLRVPNTAEHGYGKGMSIGVLLENCPPSDDDPLVPWLVAHCCAIIEARGLDVLGIYRVPGNSAAVQQLTATVNNHGSTRETGISGTLRKLDDPRWADVNVVSSLLKSFFRLLPEPLLTATLYQHFITVDKIPDCRHRLAVLHALVHKLPPAHLGTLRFFCAHLQRVAAHADINKMDARNLSIVLGPTLVRAGSGGGTAQNSMMSMISDMRHQCHLTEMLVIYADYLFTEDPKSTSTLSTLVGLDPIPSSSSSESLAVVSSSSDVWSGLPVPAKLTLLPGTSTPAFSVKEKIQSFKCGKPPMLEKSVCDGITTVPSITATTDEPKCFTPTGTLADAIVAYSRFSLRQSLTTIVPARTVQSFQKRQFHKEMQRPRATNDHETDKSELVGTTSVLDPFGDPMSLSYNERRVLAAEKAKVFEEETRAMLEKKAFRTPGTTFGAGVRVNEQRISREQTEKIWQEVKRQASLLTSDNSDIIQIKRTSLVKIWLTPIPRPVMQKGQAL